MKKISKYLILGSIISFPVLASAQNIYTISNSLIGIINILAKIFIAAAIVVFFWSLFRYLLEAANAEKKVELVKYIGFSLVVLVVAVGMWGFVELVVGIIGQSSFFGPVGPAGGFTGTPKSLVDLASSIVGIVNNAIIPVIIGIAMIYFLNSLISYLSIGGNAEKRSEAVKGMFYGIIALAIIISVNVLVAIVASIFLGGQAAPGAIPKI